MMDLNELTKRDSLPESLASLNEVDWIYLVRLAFNYRGSFDVSLIKDMDKTVFCSDEDRKEIDERIKELIKTTKIEGNSLDVSSEETALL